MTFSHQAHKPLHQEKSKEQYKDKGKKMTVWKSSSSCKLAILSVKTHHSVAAVIVLALGELFLLFVLLFSQSISSHSCEALVADSLPQNKEQQKKKQQQISVPKLIPFTTAELISC